MAMLGEFGFECQEEPTYPQMRIERQAFFEANYLTDEWNRFLNTAGNINRYTGFTLALGSLAISYINAEEMNRMLVERYAKIAYNRHKMRNIINRLHRSYEQFVRVEAHEKDDCRDFALMYGIPEIDRADMDERCWQVADIMVRDPQLGVDSSAKRVSFRVEDDPFMHEFDRTKAFFESEGLPVHMIERKVPHITWFRAVRPIGDFRMPAEWPVSMRFMPPKGVMS